MDDEALLESREFFERVVKGKVATELGFEGRDFEFLDMEKMQLLTIPIASQAAWMSMLPGREICFQPRVFRKNSRAAITSRVARVKW